MYSKKNKKDWSNTWFLRGKISSTISCPFTPGINLKRSLNKVINNSRQANDKLLVIEDGGIPIEIGLKVKDPMCPDGCIFGDTICIVQRGTNCDKHVS